MGQGQGAGGRPEQRNDTNMYDSQVRADPGPGKAVVVGHTPGPNIAGEARLQIQEFVENDDVVEGNPNNEQRLPRAHREHVKQYFDAFREGD